MAMRRRDFLAAGAMTITAFDVASSAFVPREGDMYGLISKMTAIPGKRDEVIAILLEAAINMPGCLSYIVAKDASDANAIWITEAWESQASHEAALSLPDVKEAVAKARPLVASFSDRTITSPVGGHGLVR